MSVQHTLDFKLRAECCGRRQERENGTTGFTLTSQNITPCQPGGAGGRLEGTGDILRAGGTPHESPGKEQADAQGWAIQATSSQA